MPICRKSKGKKCLVVETRTHISLIANRKCHLKRWEGGLTELARRTDTGANGVLAPHVMPCWRDNILSEAYMARARISCIFNVQGQKHPMLHVSLKRGAFFSARRWRTNVPLCVQGARSPTKVTRRSKHWFKPQASTSHHLNMHSD